MRPDQVARLVVAVARGVTERVGHREQAAQAVAGEVDVAAPNGSISVTTWLFSLMP